MKVKLHSLDIKKLPHIAIVARAILYSGSECRTGNGFAVFTRGSQRKVMRGDKVSEPINTNIAAQSSDEGWRWSAHTQPGLETRNTVASAGDQSVLKAFGQEHSL